MRESKRRFLPIAFVGCPRMHLFEKITILSFSQVEIHVSKKRKRCERSVRPQYVDYALFSAVIVKKAAVAIVGKNLLLFSQ